MRWLDPITWFGSEGYESIVSFLVEALFNGTVARIFSLIFLVIGVWFVFRRKQTVAGMGFVFVSVLIIFGKSIMAYFGF